MEEAERPENGSSPKAELSTNAKTCALCGCSTPAVRCDRCSSQIFCLSCDDMYHRHPKRRAHLRKAVDSIWSTRSPRIRTRTDWLGDPSKIPIPPPRSKKRHGGRFFLKTNHELGSFGYSKVFDEKKMSSSIKGSAAMGQKMLPNTEGNYENDPNFMSAQIPKSDEIYENGNVPMDEGEAVNSTSRNLWNTQRTNAAPFSIQPGSPDPANNGQSFGVPSRPQSRSVTDISQQPPHPFHVPPHYPYMHPHFNCPQCISSSWSNVISPSPFFHPMPWGPPMPQNGHKHGDNMNQDASFSFPYPGVPFYPNGMPLVDPTTPREMSRVKKSPSVSKEVQPMEDETVDSEPVNTEDTSTSKAADQNAAVEDDAPAVPAKPKQPWSCLHCTFINPAGILICQVCCKTSYGVQDDDDALDGRNSESPMELVNLDALRQSPLYARSQKDEEDENICADDLELPEESVAELPDEPVAKHPEETVAELPEEPVAECSSVLTTETQTLTTTTSSDAQTQNVSYKSIASSTDAIFQLQEMSVQTDFATANCSVATDPMISSQSMESLLSGMSAPPYHNRRAGWGRGTSFSTQSLFERGRSRSPLPRTFSQGIATGRESSMASEEALSNWNQGWLMSDPMYFKPQKFPSQKEDYFDGTWGSMDKLNRRVKIKPSKTLESYQQPKLHRSLGDLKADKYHDIVQTQSLQFLQIVKEAERCGFSLEDLHVAFLHCGKENPVFWLEDNWSSMVKNVIALAAKYGEDSEENDVGVISASEAKESLHIHRGDIWDAVTECIETRQRKILELTVRGNFTQKQIVEALKNNDGNVELAYADLLRAFSRRHKFILSPGMSEDSEDLTQFSTMDDVQDRTVGSSPLKTDGIVAENKADKKKSDFLTKLTSIRNAQSERRKAREEKEMFRDGNVLTPDVVESGRCPVVDEVVEKQVVNAPEMHAGNQTQETTYPNDSEEGYKTEIVEEDSKDGVADDSLPVDYDTNWVESQGEWIEEFSDEQWDEEKDEQWNELQKKYKRMENEFEEEAREMVALWEREELVDDVFEDDIKDEECFGTDVLNQEQDEKFQQWVKLDFEGNSLKCEDEEVVEGLGKKSLKESTPLSRSMELDESAFRNSPLQHYPTKVDLSEQVENDWVEVKNRTEEQFEDMVQIPTVDYKSQDKQYENADILDTEQLAELDDSDVEWEKIDIDAELLEFEKQKHALTDVAKFETDKDEAELLEECFKESIQVDRQTEDEAISIPTIANSAASYIVETSEIKLDFSTQELPASQTQIPSEVKPKPPVRRKSKLNTVFIDEVAAQQLLKDNSAQVCTDVPPALPVKRKGKTIDQTSSSDVYATPEKQKKIRTEECKVDESNIPEPPAKPPRSNLSPSAANEERDFLSPSKEGSPFSLSNESDSNCFADSESDPEIKYIRQKYMHRKPAKFEEDKEDEFFDDMAFKKEHLKASSSLNQDEKFVFSSNDDFDFGPELPIPLGSRRLKETELSTSPKAFREGTARPLQLFKAPEKETSAIKDATSPSVVEAVGLSLQDFSTLAQNVSLTAICDPSYYNIDGSSQQDDAHETSTNLTAQKMDSNLNVLNEENAMKNVYDLNQQLHLDNMNLDSPEKAMTPIQEDVFLEESNISPIPTSSYPEDLLLPEEGLFAAADYFFGRYNEVVVSKPKKKTPLTKVPKKDSDTSKSLTASEQLEVTTGSLMQTMSFINPTKPIENPSLMKTELTTNVEPPYKQEDLNVPSEIQQFYDAESKSSNPSKPEPSNTPDTEYVSFAEDYFFGSYNEVVIPKKGKKRPPAMTVSKPKTTQDLSTSLFQSALSMDVAGPVASILHSMSASVSTPGQTSLGDGIPVGENGADSKIKVKSVHFEDPQPEPPPRRNRIKVAESDRSSLSSYVSISDDYSYEQFHDCVEDFEPPDKKKLPPYSGDFKMIPDFDPYNIPSESYFYPSGELNSSVSSETSIYTNDNNNLCSKRSSACSPTEDEAYPFHEACPSLEMKNFTDLESDPAFNELSPISSDPISKQNTSDESQSNIVVDIETNDNSLEVNDRFHETKTLKTSGDISNFISSGSAAESNTILNEDKTRKYYDVCNVPELISLDDETHRISPSSFCFQKQSVEKTSIIPETRTDANNSFQLGELDHGIAAFLDTNVKSTLQKQSNKEVSNIQDVITNTDISVQFGGDYHDVTVFSNSIINSYVEEQSNEVPTVQKTINDTDSSLRFKENNLDITTSIDPNPNVDSFYLQKQSDEEMPNATEETDTNNLMQLKMNDNCIALSRETNDEMVDTSSEKLENKIPHIENISEKADLNKILDTEIKNVQQPDESMNEDLVIKTLESIHVNPTANEAGFMEGSEISSPSLESNLEESVDSLENDLPPCLKKTTLEISTEPNCLDLLENHDMEKTATSSSSLSKISKEFMLPQSKNPEPNESKYSNDSCTLDDFGDLEYLDRFNEDFEDGLRLVEEAQNLINEFDDIFPLESFKISLGNEVIGCSNKNNRDLSYDSENEWKINEEMNNSRNANFIQNDIYQMNVHSKKSTTENNLLIDTITSDSETPKLENVLVIGEEDASVKPSKAQSELMVANYNVLPDSNITAKSENLVVQTLAVLCQDLTSSAFDVEVPLLEALSTNTDSAKNDNNSDKTCVTKSDSLNCSNVSDFSSAPTNNDSNVSMLKSENELNLDPSTKRNDVKSITPHPDTSTKNDHVIISTRQNGTISSETYQERNLENNTIVSEIETENVASTEEQSKTLKIVKIDLSSEINSQTTSGFVEEELKNLTASKPDSDEHAPAKFDGLVMRNLEGELNKNKPPNNVKERVSTDVVSEQEDEISSSKVSLPSLMSHFYDELYQTAKPVQPLMQQDLRLLYATYECSASSTSSDKESIDEEYEEVINKVKSSQLEFLDDVFLTNSKKIEDGTNRHASVTSTALDSVSITKKNLEADNHIPSKSIIPDLKIGQPFSPNQPENVLIQTENINKTNVILPEKSVSKDRFCVSKHCQTEDSFEEDIFFDSFDDGLEYPILKHLVTDKAVGVETVQVNIGIQCNLITEDAASLNKLDTPKIVKEVDFNNETGYLLEVEHSIYEEAELELLNYRDDSIITCNCVGENSSDSSSDSDLFLEPQSLTEYMDSDLKNSKHNRHNFLYTEADSDTGFSSGSESGKRILHATSHIGKTEVGKGDIELSICMSSKLSDTTCSNLTSEESTKTGTSIEKTDDTVCNLSKTNSGETSRSIEIVQPSATSTNYFPQDIIDRAITPILIRKVPSIEDIVFVEVPYDINEEVIPLQIHEEPECTRSPTIEFFYGPPPLSVCSDLQDKSESFIETVELLEIDDCEKTKDNYDNIATDCYVEIELEKVDEEESLTESEYFSVANSDISNKEISLKGISSEIKYVSDLADTSMSGCLPESELCSEKFTQSSVEKIQCCDEINQNKKSCKESKSVHESSENQESRVVVVSEPDAIVLHDSSNFCITDSSSIVFEGNNLKTAECDESFYSDSISEYFPTDNDVFNTEKTTGSCCSGEIQTSKTNITKVKDRETKENIESIHLDSLNETNKNSVLIPSEVQSSRVNFPNDTQKNLLPSSKNVAEHLSSTIGSDKTTLEQETLSKDRLENLQQDVVLDSKVSNQSFPSNIVALNMSSPNMESVIPLNEMVITSDTSMNAMEETETELLNRDDLEDSFHDADDIGTGVPVVPSDIVRYLYYDDSIKFDPDSSCHDDVKTATDLVTKLHCAEEKIIHNAPFEKQVKHNLKSMDSQASNMEKIETDNNVNLSQSGNFSDLVSKSFQKADVEDNDEKCELSRESSHFSQTEISDSNLNEMYSIPTSKSAESENLDWFEAEKSAESLSEMKSMEESEQKTNSITKDLDFPCIPELIVDNKRLSKDLTKMDSDEVTDISTHFTMTDDDSDKFSDITNDSSISCLEEDNSLSVDIEISKKEEVRLANENMSLNLTNDNQSTESVPRVCRQLESGGIENFNKVIESPISINSESDVIFNEKISRIDQVNVDQAVTNSKENELATGLLNLGIFSTEKEDAKAEDNLLDPQTDDIDSWNEACDKSDTEVEEDLQFFSPEDIPLNASEENKLSEKIPNWGLESPNLTERNINNYETKEFESGSSPKGVDTMPDPVSDVINPEYILNFSNVKDVTISPDDVCCVEVTNHSDGAVTFIRMEPSEFDADSTDLDFPLNSKSVSLESIQTVVDSSERTLQRSDLECQFVETVVESEVCPEKHGASKEFNVHDVEVEPDILNYSIGSFTNDDKECLQHNILKFDSHCSSDATSNMNSLDKKSIKEMSSHLTDTYQVEEITTPPKGDAQSVIIEITSITSDIQEKDSSSDLSYHSLSDASISDFEEESEVLRNNAQNGHYQESDITLEEEIASTTVSCTVNANVKEPLAETTYLEKLQETYQIREVRDDAFECSATSPENPPCVEPPVCFKSLENIQFNDTKDHEVSLLTDNNILQISSETTSLNLNSLCSSVVAKNSQEDLIALSSALVEPSDNCSILNENKAQYKLNDSNLALSTHTIALEALTSDIKEQSSVVNVTELTNVSDVKQLSRRTELDKSVSLDNVYISSEYSNGTIVGPSTLQPMPSSNEISLNTAKQESIYFSETDSSSYFSAREDIENISSICSDDDFTDVESHFTTTDSSDAWDDVETDVSIGEDFEFGNFLPPCRSREQTPTLGTDFTALESEIEHSAKAKEISLSIESEDVCGRNGEPTKLDETLILQTDFQLSNNNELQTISESKTISEEVSAGTNVKHALFENSESLVTLDGVSVKIEALHCDQNEKNEITEPFKITQVNDLKTTKSKEEEEYNNDNIKGILTASHEVEEMNPESCKEECDILKLGTNLDQYTLEEDISDAMSFNSVSSECEKLSDSEASNIFDNAMIPCTYDKDFLDHQHPIQDIDSEILKESIQSTNILKDQSSTCKDDIFLVEQIQLNMEARESDSVPKLHESSLKELVLLSQENIALSSDETKTEIVNVSEKFSRTDIISDLDESLSSSLVQDVNKNIPGIIDSNEKEFSVCEEVETSFNQTDEGEISFVSLTKDDFSDKSSEIESFADFDDSKSVYDKLSKPEYTVSDEKLVQFDLPSSSKALKISADSVASESNIRCTENILLENFADVKSLNEQSSLAETTYVEFDAVTAVLLIHDETTEKSLRIEKTDDSDNWLKADTDYSISEFEDEAVSISVNEMCSASEIQDSVVITDNRVELEKASSLEHSSGKITDFSVSFHTDTENSDKASDTCAEISLQGFTMENSDKWSDIEGDEINAEQYQKNAQFVGTNVKVADVTQGNIQEEYLVEQTNIHVKNLDVEVSTSSLEQNFEVSLETLEDKYQIETDDCLKMPEPLISDNQPISGLSDEDFTDVTPLDGTSDSDKWSDVSDVASIDEIVDKDIARICDSNNETVLFKEDGNERNKLEVDTEFERNFEEAEMTMQNKLNLAIETSHVDSSFESKGEELLKQSEETVIVFGDTIHVSDSAEIFGNLALSEKEEISELQSDKTIHPIQQECIQEEADNSVSKLLEDEGSLKVQELNLNGNLHSIQAGEDFIHGENFTAGGNAGSLDEFNSDYETNEFDDENAEFDDEEYVSEPFVINDDEFVYPIQYDNWIEESFDLKEYGIDGAFSESEEDFYTKAEEDIRRAIDFSTGTFEEAMEGIMDEENVTTESFKTLSSHATTFSKPTEKEYESWSTADAESIEDDLNDDDDDEVLSKIDELLAEEFGCDNSSYKETIFDTIQEKEEELELSEISHVKTTQNILEGGIQDSFETERDLSCPKTEELNMVTNSKNMAEFFEERSNDKDKSYMNNIPVDSNIIPVKQEKDHVNLENLKMNVYSEVEKEQEGLSQLTKDEKPKLKKDELFTHKLDKNTEKNKESLESKIQSEETELKEENLKGCRREESSVAKMKDTINKEQNIELIEEKSTISTKDLKSSELQRNSASFKNDKNNEPRKENLIDLTGKDKTVQNNQTSEKSTEELKTGELSKSERMQSENEKKEKIVKGQETMLLQSKITADEMEKRKSHSEGEKEAKTLTSTEKTVEAIEIKTQDSTNKESNFEFQKGETKDSKKCTFTLKDEKVVLKKVKETSSAPNDEKKELEEDTKTNSSIKTNLETDFKRERNKISLINASSENKTTEMSEQKILDAIEIKKIELRNEEDIKQNDEHKNSQSKKEMEDAHNEIKNSKFEKDKLSESHIMETNKTNAIEVSSENKNVEITTTKTIDSVEGLVNKTLKSATQEDIQSTTPSIEIAKSSNEVKNEMKEISRSEKSAKKVENIPTETEQKKTKDSKSNNSLHSVSYTDEVKRGKIDESRSDISSKKVEDIPSENETKTKTKDSIFNTFLASATNTDEVKSEKTSVTRKDKSSAKTEDIPSEFKQNVSSDPSSTVLSPPITDAIVEESSPTKTDVLSEKSASKPELSIRRRRSRPNTEPDTEENIPVRRRRSSLLRQTQAAQSGAASSEPAPSLPPKRCRSGSASSSSDSLKSCLSLSSESLSYDTPVRDDSISEPFSPKDDEVAVPDVPLRKARIRPSRSDSSEESSSGSANRSSSSWSRGSMPIELAADPNRKRTSIDERMLKLHTEGKCTNKEKAFIAAKLIEMQFEEEDALLASRQCSSVYHAVKFLTQLCELCNCRFPVNLMASMVYCTHRACRDCLKAHFTNLIYDRSVFTLLCPICHKPDITDHNIQEYFNHLEMMFRDILESNVYDLFQRKLRDEVLTKDPNFHWCSQCSNGFIASPRLKKLYCPDCSAITCASCHQTWELEHEGVHCERFQQWKDMHTPEPPPAGLVKFLTDRGITCPSCGIVYAQACGGCILYKCAHCTHEFCGFCSKPCNKGKDCLNKGCDLRGVHAHHKSNCLFFLRDKDLSELQLLLEEEGVKFLTLPPKDQIVKSRCQVREQKHIHGTLSEDRCVRDIVPYCAGLCRTHYYEYLCELLRRNKIDPLSIMTIGDFQLMLRKSRIFVPEKVKGETNDEYYARLAQVVSKALS